LTQCRGALAAIIADTKEKKLYDQEDRKKSGMGKEKESGVRLVISARRLLYWSVERDIVCEIHREKIKELRYATGSSDICKKSTFIKKERDARD